MTGDHQQQRRKKHLQKLLGQIKKSSATVSTASAFTHDAQIDLEISRTIQNAN
jgi:hypothetical protein